ncbi:alkyl hydroperoxide reductase/ thiol specific antioxidant/ Mal allergen [Dunaliella salina]|uniref:Alkyl hydroperoxide reductase/ thiol specific antioxidant/ Mal allergen n=1 Tax=Dunaliella salina TaxID=3046 RepID=A0ABQ7GJ82_DUNSA|nr:alkyl hydroperoxide reductase/ thiol specific antioxidant/ Mal allergen [Dunaliella salina]|eukprot:KAF5834654.1 alkyl hydroperoxide reductase/ thiol specific antioxidant/ Mal allergen [Dunaliella salina]
MVMTQSSGALAPGHQAPDFELPEPANGNKPVRLSDFKGSPVLVMFICNHCPFVIHLKEAIVRVAAEYQAKGFKVVAISSNSPVTHPQDGPEKMVEDAKKYGYTFPYVFDEDQVVAKAYSAACTPEFYVLKPDHTLAYHGQFDASRPKADSAPITGQDLKAAMDAVLEGKPCPPGRPSIGCNIKWTPGKEPPYFASQQI